MDKKKFQFMIAVDISYLDKEVQEWVCKYVKENGSVKVKQITALIEACEADTMTQANAIAIMNQHQVGRLLAVPK